MSRKYIGTALPSLNSLANGSSRYFRAGSGSPRGVTVKVRSISHFSSPAFATGGGLSWAGVNPAAATKTKQTTDHRRSRIIGVSSVEKSEFRRFSWRQFGRPGVQDGLVGGWNRRLRAALALNRPCVALAFHGPADRHVAVGGGRQR